MKSIRKVFLLFLAAAMLLTVTACGAADTPAVDPTPAEPKADAPAEEIDAQLLLLFSDMSVWNLDSAKEQWQYTVTDLDHNGLLEMIAAKYRQDDRGTDIKLWEISKDSKGLDECKVRPGDDGAIPDIITENADTFYTAKSGDWVYFFYDNTLFDGGAKTAKCSVQLRSGELVVTEYAFEISETDANGQTTVTHQDLNGMEIPAEAYNDAGIDSFTGSMRGSTNLDWFGMGEVADVTRLTGSYRVFTGEKQPPNPHVAPVPMPVPSSEPEPSPAPAPSPTPVPTPIPIYLTITKNPTNEYRKEGETAYFVAAANTYTSVRWTLVSPDGGEYTSQTFDWLFPNAAVDGEYSTTLSISNVSSAMSGWGAYCTFYLNDQTARTSTAYLSVQAAPQPTPVPTGHISGTVSGYSYASVSINLQNGTAINVNRSICDEDGSIYMGAPCEAYYNGSGSSIVYYYVYIQGQHMVGPIYGSMSGTISSHSEGSLTITLQSGSVVSVSTSIMNLVSGVLKDGCSCTVYYQNYPSSDYIYKVDVIGANEGTGFGFGAANPDS